MPTTSKTVSMLIAISLLSACATQDPKRVMDAATSPLNDLNLIREEIPAALTRAQEKPYAMPVDASCESMALEVQELEKALGPDLDAKAVTDVSKGNPVANLAQMGVDRVKDSAIGTITTATHSAIPFRDWVRKLTGAEAYAEKVTASVHAGTVRRAFIKGIVVAKECH